MLLVLVCLGPRLQTIIRLCQLTSCLIRIKFMRYQGNTETYVAEMQRPECLARNSYYISDFFIVLWIQRSWFLETKEYTPGFVTSPHCFPKDVTPTSAPLQIRGPPESPWEWKYTRVIDKHTTVKEVMTGCCISCPYLTGVGLLFADGAGTYHATGDHRITVVVLGGVALDSVDDRHIDGHQDVGHFPAGGVCFSPPGHQATGASFWVLDVVIQPEVLDCFGLLCCFFKLKF